MAVVKKSAKTSKKITPAKKPVVTKTSARKTVKTSGKVTKKTNGTLSRQRPMQASNVGAMQKTMAQQQVMHYVKNPRLWVGGVVVLVAILLYVYKGLFIAATVNGQPVSRLSVISQLEQQGGKQQLDTLIAETLVMQEAQKRNITIPQSQIDSEVKVIETQLKGQGTTLDDALAARGMNRNDLEKQMKIQDLLNKMVGSMVKITDKDVQSYIDKNKDSLPQNLSDTDLQKQVRAQLQQQQLQDKTQTFLASLQKQAKISYFVNY